jgi:hypothetical protein
MNYLLLTVTSSVQMLLVSHYFSTQSIPGGVTGFLSDIFPSDRSMALGSTQPLVKMSTRKILGGKGGRCVRLTSTPSCAECHEIWEPKPPGTLWATPGLLRDCFTLLFHSPRHNKDMNPTVSRAILFLVDSSSRSV